MGSISSKREADDHSLLRVPKRGHKRNLSDSDVPRTQNSDTPTADDTSSNPDASASEAKDTKETHEATEGLDEEGNKMINEYILLRSIGKGSYAKVKLAMSAISEQAYAIKIMHKQSLIRKLGLEGGLGTVEREIAILKKLKHPNVVRLFEVIDDPDNDRLFLVLEYVSQGAVRELSMDGTAEPLDIKTARDYFRQTVQGLEYLHSLRILHRDIKPENLLLDDEGTVKLTDFGVSQLYDGEDDTLTASAGTPAFLAPEACSGDANTEYSGKAADIWALGVTLFVFVFGYLPFRSDGTVVDLYNAILKQELEVPQDTDNDLCDLFRRILDKNPKTRATLGAIKSHPWVTEHGAHPMANNKATEEVKISEEEVGDAIHRLSNVDRFALLVKVKSRLAKKAEEARERLAVQSTFSSAASTADEYMLPSDIRARRRQRSASAFTARDAESQRPKDSH